MTKKTPSTPKPWRDRVIRLHHMRFGEHIDWTEEEWQRFNEKRKAKRNKRKRPFYKVSRLQDQARERDRQARSQRMKAYHARQRAALAAEKNAKLAAIPKAQ